MKNLQRRIRFAAFDARTRLLIARFYIKCLVLDLKYQGLKTVLARIARDRI